MLAIASLSKSNSEQQTGMYFLGATMIVCSAFVDILSLKISLEVSSEPIHYLSYKEAMRLFLEYTGRMNRPGERPP